MIFKERNKVVYCKDKYHEEFNNDKFFIVNKKIEYYKGYLVHRDDGPAIEYEDYDMFHDKNDKVWYKEGMIHREDGPAIEYSDGAKWWFLNAIQYSKEEHNRIINKIININNKRKVLDDI